MSSSPPTAGWSPWSIVWLLGAAVLLQVGCASRVYHAAALPTQFQAPPVENTRVVDLSRLSNYVASNEMIDVGDVLDVSVAVGAGSTEITTFPVRVNEQGVGDVPFVGPVPLAGLELQAAEQAIRAASVQRGVYHNPHVTVTMRRQRVNQVTVIGAVNEPGVYALPRGRSGLLQALVAAKGLSDEAGTDVEIRRASTRHLRHAPGTLPEHVAQPHDPRIGGPGPAAAESGPASVTINLVAAVREGLAPLELEDGDVVMVQRRDPQPIQVLGLVRKPGQYELPVHQELRVLDALALAGGRSTLLTDKLRIIRRVPGQAEPVVITLSVGDAMRSGAANLRLAPGDTISVEPNLMTYLSEVMGMARFGLGATVSPF